MDGRTDGRHGGESESPVIQRIAPGISTDAMETTLRNQKKTGNSPRMEDGNECIVDNTMGTSITLAHCRSCSCPSRFVGELATGTGHSLLSERRRDDNGDYDDDDNII